MLKILKGDHKVNLLSRVQLFATAWTIAHQAPPSMEFSRQEYWSGLPFPSPGDLLNPGIKPWSHALWADALPSEPPWNQAFTSQKDSKLNIRDDMQVMYLISGSYVK